MKLKGLLALLVAATAFVVWQIRKRTAKARLEQFDRGERCVACNSVNLTVTNGKARCNQCGHVTNLAFYQQAKLTESEIASITRPDTRRQL